MRRRWSLQSRLLALLALLLALLWTGLEVSLHRDADRQALAELKGELRATTDLLAVAIPDEMQDPEQTRRILSVAQQGAVRFPSPAYEVRRAGEVVLRSPSFPAFPAPLPPGGTTVRIGSEVWHVFTATDVDAEVTRRALLPDSARVLRSDALRSQFSRAWTLALPLFAIVVLASVWLGLRPLRRIEARMGELSADAPEPLGLDPERMPRELGDLVRRFDRLVGRVAQVMSGQRIFASAASHELRTPLAGALSQVEILRRAPERRTALDRLAEALVHMERLVTHLLFLARSETLAAADPPERVDLAALAREVCGELGLGTRSRVEGEEWLEGSPDLLRSLLRCLLHNAREASEEEVVVAIGSHGARITVDICDRGPGIAAEDRQRVLEPFHRGERATTGGSGLGLTVAQRIAERHGGWIEITDRLGGGAIVRVIFEPR